MHLIRGCYIGGTRMHNIPFLGMRNQNKEKTDIIKNEKLTCIFVSIIKIIRLHTCNSSSTENSCVNSQIQDYKYSFQIAKNGT